jgi:hypothetical protein
VRVNVSLRYTYVPGNSINMLSVAQKTPLWRIYIKVNDKIYLGLNVKCQMFLSDFNQIWSFSTGFS